MLRQPHPKFRAECLKQLAEFGCRKQSPGNCRGSLQEAWTTESGIAFAEIESLLGVGVAGSLRASAYSEPTASCRPARPQQGVLLEQPTFRFLGRDPCTGNPDARFRAGMKLSSRSATRSKALLQIRWMGASSVSPVPESRSSVAYFARSTGGRSVTLVSEAWRFAARPVGSCGQSSPFENRPR